MNNYWSDELDCELIVALNGYRLLYQDGVYAICPPVAEPRDAESTFSLAGEEMALETFFRYAKV